MKYYYNIVNLYKMLDIQNSIPLIGSEIALSLYPQLIKLVPTTIDIQVAVRFITYSILALIGYYSGSGSGSSGSGSGSSGSSGSSSGGSSSKNSLLPTLSSLGIGLVIGIVNIIHIISSYTSFSILSSGVSYSIFYTYPIFNLIGRTLFYNETILPINYVYIGISIIGVFLIYKKETETEKETENFIYDKDGKYNTFINSISNTNNLNSKTIGIISGIISALTESIIYFIVKSGSIETSPFLQLIKTYLLGGIVSVIYLIKNINYVKNIKLDIHYWISLILFNSIVGFLGYLLRFIMIPQLSTLLFNSLIFIGVIFSYIWGYILSNETINNNNILGTLLIVWSIFQINKK